ncbi:MAG TPA: hypothetical protein HPP58_08055 [Deltaproteobacteria bacterium]|nr:hypothetical protein [Deltaproteobacteria bacterium]
MCILVELIRGEEIRHTNSNAFNLLKKGHGMRFCTFADDVCKNDLVDRVECDPNPGIAQDSFKFFDGLQVGFLFADKGPHFVELALRDREVFEESTGDSYSMTCGSGEDPQDRLFVYIHDSCRGSNAHTLC